MKIPASRVALIAGMIAVACLLAASALHAASDDKADKKDQKSEADLKKYDRNANGKLDPDEEAALKADVEKQKGERKKKKRGR
jgi:hypothetical protein